MSLKLTTILLLLNVSLCQATALNSRVELQDKQSICILTYSFPQESSDRKIMYRTIGSQHWLTIEVDHHHGTDQINALQEDKLYVAQLSWKDKKMDLFTSETHYFRTYAALSQGTPYYKNYRVIIPKAIHDYKAHAIYQGQASFKYKDQYLQQGYLQGEVFDENHQVINRFFLQKTPDGLYHVDLLKIQYGWEEKVNYSIKIFDELNVPKWFSFTFENLNGELDVSIDTQSMYVSCTLGENSIIQYRGLMEGGSFPFEATWTIRNQSGHTILNGPVKSTPAHEGELPTITVEQPLPYIITLSGFDGCGKFKEVSLLVSCANHKNEKTLLFERVKTNQNDNN